MDLVEMKQVKKTYIQGKIEVQAVKGVSFNVAQGDFSALAGPSGSGKTTLLNLIGTLDQATEGHIFLNGTDLSELDKKAQTNFRLKHIGFVFQFFNLIPVFNVVENVEYILMLQGASKKLRRERAVQMLEEMKIGELLYRFPKELSGGQQQRVAVARALCASPDLILADEPTANLDRDSADNLLEIMEEMSVKKNTAFLFSTHDPRVMARAKRLITLRDGLIEKDEVRKK